MCKKIPIDVEEEKIPFDNNNTLTIPWECDFGTDINNPDWCGFIPGEPEGNGTFVPGEGETPTPGTGPPGTTDDDHGKNSNLVKKYRIRFLCIYEFVHTYRRIYLR